MLFICRLQKMIEKYENEGPISMEEHESHVNHIVALRKENETLKEVCV